MKVFLRFAISKAVIPHGLELLMGFTSIVQGVMNTIMTTAGFEKMTKTRLPEEVVTSHRGNGLLRFDPALGYHTDRRSVHLGAGLYYLFGYCEGESGLRR